MAVPHLFALRVGNVNSSELDTDFDYLDDRVAVATVLPTGTLVLFAGSTTPTNFLLAKGAAVSRQTYSALFLVIGTTYGAGDGSTTFNVPNMTDVQTLKSYIKT